MGTLEFPLAKVVRTFNSHTLDPGTEAQTSTQLWSGSPTSQFTDTLVVVMVVVDVVAVLVVVVTVIGLVVVDVLVLVLELEDVLVEMLVLVLDEVVVEVLVDVVEDVLVLPATVQPGPLHPAVHSHECVLTPSLHSPLPQSISGSSQALIHK